MSSDLTQKNVELSQAAYLNFHLVFTVVANRRDDMSVLVEPLCRSRSV